MKSLNILILNFNSGEYLIKCLESINKSKDEANIKTVVIDNNSTDGSYLKAQKSFKDIEFIQNRENLGFSKGYNEVLKKVKSEFILLLNPDCILEEGVIKKILDCFEDDLAVGAATCKIVLPDGRIDSTAHRGFPTPLASLLYFLGNDRRYHLTDRISDKSHEVDAITGAFFMTKKQVLEKSGYLDEDFFLYGEDIDLCLRIKNKGYKIIYDPTVKITHYKGISSGLKKHSQEFSQADLKTRQKARDSFYAAMIIFYDKHYRKKYFFLINWLVYLGIYLKWGISKFKITV